MEGIRDPTTWSLASIDGRISHRVKWTPSSRLDQVTQGNQTAVEIFRTFWEHINTLISDEVVEPLLTHNGLIHNAALRASCYLFSFNKINVEFIPDIHIDSTSELFGMPILEFKNVHVPPVGSNVQVHGIVLRALPTKVAA